MQHFFPCPQRPTQGQLATFAPILPGGFENTPPSGDQKYLWKLSHFHQQRPSGKRRQKSPEITASKILRCAVAPSAPIPAYKSRNLRAIAHSHTFHGASRGKACTNSHSTLRCPPAEHAGSRREPERVAAKTLLKFPTTPAGLVNAFLA